jgi:hypothetical protein
MSIDAISSTSAIPPYRQTRTDFQSLSQALQSGNLSAAQSAYAALQQDQQNGPQPPAGSPLANDFNALGQALQSGDLTGAQQAFASLKSDFQSLRQASGGHHGGHKGGGGGDDATNALDSSSSSNASTTVVSETTTTNADGTITVTMTYADGTTSSAIQPNPNPPVSLNPLAPNPGQWTALLGAQEQASVQTAA